MAIAFETGWESKDYRDVSVATTFEQLLEIALVILSRIPDPVGIVCGPLTTGGLGSLEANTEEFKRRIGQLQQQGENIFNQMPFEPRMQKIKKTPYYDPTRDHLLEAFYGGLFKKERLKTLFIIPPGEKMSYGLNWEIKRGELLGKNIVYLE